MEKVSRPPRAIDHYREMITNILTAQSETTRHEDPLSAMRQRNSAGIRAGELALHVVSAPADERQLVTATQDALGQFNPQLAELAQSVLDVASVKIERTNQRRSNSR